MGLMLSACSDFLDRKPLTQPDNTTFLSGRGTGRELYQCFIPGIARSGTVWNGCQGRRGEQRQYSGGKV